MHVRVIQWAFSFGSRSPHKTTTFACVVMFFSPYRNCSPLKRPRGSKCRRRTTCLPCSTNHEERPDHLGGNSEAVLVAHAPPFAGQPGFSCNKRVTVDDIYGTSNSVAGAIPAALSVMTGLSFEGAQTDIPGRVLTFLVNTWVTLRSSLAVCVVRGCSGLISMRRSTMPPLCGAEDHHHVYHATMKVYR